MATQGCLNGGAGGLAQGFFYPHMVWELFWGLLGFLWGPTFSESAFKMLFPQPLHSPKAVTVFYSADVAQEIHTWPGERVDSCNSIIYVNKIVATMVGRWGHILGGGLASPRNPRVLLLLGLAPLALRKCSWNALDGVGAHPQTNAHESGVSGSSGINFCGGQGPDLGSISCAQIVDHLKSLCHVWGMEPCQTPPQAL